MASIHGNFAIFRTKTPDGKNAIMLVPEGLDIGLAYSANDEKDESGEIDFGLTEGGENPPESYLTIRYADDFVLHFGPYRPMVT